MHIGSPGNPLKIAIVGSGPAGFYSVSNLLKEKDLNVHMDMYEKLPTPFGLVRAGVAPDHQKYKTVTKAYDKSAAAASFRFFGNIEFGKHLHLADLQAHYHQVIFATGAQSDRSLGIPGEAAIGSHSATDFVAWYNGHPDFTDCSFDLSGRSAAIIGLGNVAVDVARILCKTPQELERTDMADYALAALANSQIREVFILGRRGPAQAAFTTPEIKEMGELSDADIHVHADEAALDDASRAALQESGDKNAQKNVDVVNEFAAWQASGKDKQLTIRFLVSPTAILTNDHNEVCGIRIVRNTTYLAEDGSVRVKPSDEHETLPVDLVFRSVGYQGTALPGIPFDADTGVIPNQAGRVLNEQGQQVPGVYVAGWIKRGPSGVIGSNKTDAKETVLNMLADMRTGVCWQPQQAGVEAIENLLRERQPDLVSYRDWRQLDDIELSKGVVADRPRVKFTDVSEMLSALER